MSVDKRIEYVKGKLSKRVSEYYGFNGALSERWIAIFNESERVIENFGLKADGRPLGMANMCMNTIQRGGRIVC